MTNAVTRTLLIETMAKNLGLSRYANYERPVRWPDHAKDTIADRSGRCPLTWDYAEQCRREVIAMLEGLELEPTLPPYPAANGMVYKPYQIEYELPISTASWNALRQADGHHHELNDLIKSLPFPISMTLQIADDNGWAFFITLLAEHDTKPNRDMLADTIKSHLDLCRESVA